MARYQPAEPPPTLEPSLRAYLDRELRAIAAAMQDGEPRIIAPQVYQSATALPDKVRGGELARVGDTTVVYEQDVSAWRKVNATAYGEMQLASPPAAFPNLTSTWQPLTVFDTATVVRGVVMDTATGRFTFEEPGLYLLTLIAAFEHNSANSGRIFGLRLWNVTDSVVAGGPLWIGTGRNAEYSNIWLGRAVSTGQTDTDEVFEWQLATQGDTYSSVSFESCAMDVVGLAEYALD